MNTQTNKTTPFIILFGRSGAGKGTLIEMLQKDNNTIEHVSSGSILRKLFSQLASRYDQSNFEEFEQEVLKNRNTIYTKDQYLVADIHAKHLIAQGGFLDDQNMKRIALAHRISPQAQLIILDGVVRRGTQVIVAKEFAQKNNGKIICAIEINCDRELCIQRIQKRNAGRPEDQKYESIINRLDAYDTQRQHIIESLQTHKIPLHIISNNNEPEEMYQEAQQIINRLL